jgi:hypothetical protein
VTLEVSNVAGLAATLQDPSSRLGKTLSGKGRNHWLGSKIALKLEASLSYAISPLFQDSSLGEIVRHLLGGAGMLAVYDIEKLRFLYVVETNQATRLQDLLALVEVERRKLTLGGSEVELVGTPGGGLYLWKQSGLLLVSNHAGLVQRATDLKAADSLGHTEDYSKVIGDLPAGLLRLFVAPATFDTVYMRNYWVGAPGHHPPQEAVAASLSLLPGSKESYQEVRHRTGKAPAPLQAVRELSSKLPAWSFREAGQIPLGKQRKALATSTLACLLPRPRTSRAHKAMKVLSKNWESWLREANGYGVAGRIRALPRSQFHLGSVPEGAFASATDRGTPLHYQEQFALVLRFPEGGAKLLSPIRKALCGYFQAVLQLPMRPQFQEDRLHLPLLKDLDLEVFLDHGLLVLTRGEGSSQEVRSGLGPDFEGRDSQSYRLASFDATALSREAQVLVEVSRARSGWYARQRADFAENYLLAAHGEGLSELRNGSLVQTTRAGLLVDRGSWRFPR